MKRLSFLVALLTVYVSAFARTGTPEEFLRDSLFIIEKNPAKGFHHSYVLFIPKGTVLHNKTYLLVEPNNTGQLSDSIAVHKRAAIYLAAVNSVGNNISTELKIPLLVPIFPRPASRPLLYTHALDRDIMTEKETALERLDLQLLAMIKDADSILQLMHIRIHPQFFMNGFSASATFTNRFSFIHPDKIKALAIGGFNGELMHPLGKINEATLNYPLGTNDFETLFNKQLDLSTYRSIPQFIYMGKLDDNDAVQFDDAYDEKERDIINNNIGRQVQERYLNCQKIYLENNIHPVFTTYENVGHWTTPAMNLAVIKFFLAQMQAGE